MVVVVTKAGNWTDLNDLLGKFLLIALRRKAQQSTGFVKEGRQLPLKNALARSFGSY